MSRLDVALSNSGLETNTLARHPANLRVAANYCRELAGKYDEDAVRNLIAVAEQLELEALEKERISRRLEPVPGGGSARSTVLAE